MILTERDIRAKIDIESNDGHYFRLTDEGVKDIRELLEAQEQQTFVELVEWLGGRQLLHHDIEYWGVGRTRNNTCRKTCPACWLLRMAKLVKACQPQEFPR
jgi:hypothetical protein